MSTKLQNALGVMFLVADSNATEGGSHCKEAIWLADVLKLNPFNNSKTTKLLLKGKDFCFCFPMYCLFSFFI